MSFCIAVGLVSKSAGRKVKTTFRALTPQEQEIE
jgi:hypothetical protein